MYIIENIFLFILFKFNEFISGARFAIYQTKIGLIKILRNYKVDVCSKTLIPYKYDPFSFILVPLGGLYLKITRIQD